MNGGYCYPSSHLLPDEVRNTRILDGGERGAGSMKADPRSRIDSNLGLRLLRECMNSIRRISVFVSRQLRKDEKDEIKKMRLALGEEVGAPSAAVGVYCLHMA